MPHAIPIYLIELPVDEPAGKYKLLATFERGASPTCVEVEFWVDDPNQMASVESVITTWGVDSLLAKWLSEHHIKTQPKNKVKFLPLEKKGSISNLYSWLYLKDEWAKQHPIFEGLPSEGLMDHLFYREIIPATAFVGQDTPKEAVAGSTKSSLDYASELMVSVNSLGAGGFILNTLLIRDNLGTHPAAERLLRNMLRFAAQDLRKPVEKLPVDFGAKLMAIGYK